MVSHGEGVLGEGQGQGGEGKVGSSICILRATVPRWCFPDRDFLRCCALLGASHSHHHGDCICFFGCISSCVWAPARCDACAAKIFVVI